MLEALVGFAWERKQGGQTLKGFAATAGTGTMRPGPYGLGWGRLSEARVGTGVQGSDRCGLAQRLRRQPGRYEPSNAARVPGPAPGSEDREG